MNISIRRKLIDETKGYAKNINGRVADMQQRKILGITEQVEPYIQLNEQDIRKMEEITTILKQLLAKKLLTVHQFKDEITPF